MQMRSPRVRDCSDRHTEHYVRIMSNFLTLNLVVHKATTRLSYIIRVPDRVAKKFRTTNHNNSLLLKSALYFHITVCPSLAVLQYIPTRSNSTGRLSLPSGNFPSLIVCVCAKGEVPRLVLALLLSLSLHKAT
jgi:hypothetical protein